MLTNMQIAFLENMYGPEGDYFLTIMGSPACNLGTKILYLKRAVTQSEDVFLRSLDTFYSFNPTLESLELIRLLKTLNDLCFNHTILYNGEEMGAHSHFFGHPGPLPSFNILRDKIKTMINDPLALLMQDPQQRKTVNSEIMNQKWREMFISPNPNWRTQVDSIPPLKRVVPSFFNCVPRFNTPPLSVVLAHTTFFPPGAFPPPLAIQPTSLDF